MRPQADASGPKRGARDGFRTAFPKKSSRSDVTLSQEEFNALENLQDALKKASAFIADLDLGGVTIDEMHARVRDRVAVEHERIDAEYEAEKRAQQIVDATEGRR